MFDFIGAKIRLVAKVQCWIGIIASVIVGFKVMLSDDGGTAFLIGLLILVFGTLFSYVGSFLLYGFGQLVDNSDEIVAQMHRAARREEDEFQIVNSGCAQPQAPVPSHDSVFTEEYCEFCHKKGTVVECVVKDEMGTRYRKACPTCMREKGLSPADE